MGIPCLSPLIISLESVPVVAVPDPVRALWAVPGAKINVRQPRASQWGASQAHSRWPNETRATGKLLWKGEGGGLMVQQCRCPPARLWIKS